MSGRELELAAHLNTVIEEADIADRLLGQFKIDLDGTNTLYQRNLQALGAVRRVAKALMGNADVNRVCKEIVEAIADELGAEQCSILLLQHRILRLEAGASCSDSEHLAREYPSRIFRVGEGVAGQVVQSGNAILIEDVQGDSRWVPLEGTVTVRSILCVPLRTADEPILGVLNLSHTTPGFYTLDHVRLFELLCPLVSQLISFAQLHSTLRRAHRGLEDRVKGLEDQFRASQKMEAIGTLAGGVAHDFNNLLTAMTCYTELLLDGIDARDPLHEHASQLRKAHDRAAALTKQLLAFSRRQILKPQVFNLNSVIENTTDMLERLIGDNVELVHIADPALACVEADPGQIEQVIMNLAVNARDAMPQGGRLIIQTENFVAEDVYIDRHVNIPPGRYALLTVTDTGMGMDTSTQARIFEPFFTTKGPDKGTGLGLSTVHGIVNQSGGHVSWRTTMT